jgi:hypothetical protein
MASFKKTGYIVIKKAISKEMAKLVCDYLLRKRKCVDFLYEHNVVPRHQPSYLQIFGGRDDPQVPGVFSCYGDFLMDTLLLNLINKMEKLTKVKLVPTYSFARVYEKGAILARHHDRRSCEISTTLNLGGDPWPIYIDSTGTKSVTSAVPGPKGYIVKLKKNAPKGTRVDLNPGDMLVYRGDKLEHWRDKFKGKECVQVFLHYNNLNGPFGKYNKFDGRPMVGLPVSIQVNPSQRKK